ncbi:hypothetical protein OEZ86_002833 [Tetradesmus obliquus]|nr:hypothetical protein OEZ86_002833 [Tetradesmus obliquus]
MNNEHSCSCTSSLAHLPAELLPTCSSVVGGGASVASSYSSKVAAEQAAVIAYSAVLGTALGQLVQLTMLSLSTDCAWRLGGLALALLSSLSNLQRLELATAGTDQHPVQMQNLPGSLTALSLTDIIVDSTQDISSCCQLSRLQQLELSATDVPATMLRHVPWLQTLFLDASMKKHAVLPMLPQLQHIRSVILEEMQGAAAASDYAALTASSQLEKLQLTMCGIAGSAAEHMFAAGRLLPQLHSISIQSEFENPWFPTEDKDSDDEDDDCALVLGPGDAARLAACCPGLQALGTLAVEADVTAADLLPLLQLTALTRLELGGHGCGDDVAQQVLAKMTGLVHLEVLYCPSLTPSGCAHLTSLTALTCLRLQHCRTFALDDGVSSDEDGDGPLSVVTFQSKVTPPDVWARLQQECMRDPAALAVMYQHAQQRLAAQEQQLQEQAQQLQQARQQIQQLSQAV